MVTCDAFIQPLDLQCIFVNLLAGDWIIFGLLAIVFIVSLAAEFRMSNAVTGGALLLFGVLFYTQLPWILYLGILFGGIIIWAGVATLWKR